MTDSELDFLEDLPRYPAPAQLRAAILRAAGPSPAGRWWWPAGLSAAATAMAMALLWVSVLPRVAPADPLQRAIRAIVSEHTRILIWGETHPQAIPQIIPASLSRLEEETGIGLERAFVGDSVLRFVAAEPIYLEEQRGIAFHYTDPGEHLVSYLVLPAPGLAVPERSRVQVARYRPGLARNQGLAILVWKHGDLASFLVSDMVAEADLERFKGYFLRIREATKLAIEE
jgi:hypothetical protein